MHASVQSRFAPILYVLIFYADFLTAQIWFNQKAYTEELASASVRIVRRRAGVAGMGVRVGAFKG